ncbi:unnamed protein product [Symbiodinium natans]|uniref:Uncharacterized protein n=1 Tax=Symbiodinium natans TaxID=878477 RepID=A0A812QUB1_9DINO|nr:unnamed protein product [Symbiodinium natans]
MVTAGWGAVFGRGLTGTIGVASLDDLETEAARMQAHEAYTSAFRKCQAVTNVDVFVSHNWGARRWVKFLAVCYFLNLSMAIKCTLASALFCATCKVLKAGSLAGLGGDPWIMPFVVYLPMSIFFIMFFFGQTITRGRWSPSLWIDKLCVLQTDESMKAKAVSAFPVFLARSSQMLVLWDDDYFDRMWCNLELATFTRFSSQCTQKIHFVPMWLAPWLLAFILMDLLSVSMLRFISNVISEPAVFSMMMASCNYFQADVLGIDSRDLNLLLVYVATCVAGCTPYYITAVPSVLAFLNKMRKHHSMLRQIVRFDVRAAKCALESDRQLVEKRIGELLGSRIGSSCNGNTLDNRQNLHNLSNLYSPASGLCSGGLRTTLMMAQNLDPLDCFNAYVRGPLMEAVLEKVGDSTHVPYRLCLVASLPMTLFSVVDLLSCSNERCQLSAGEVNLSLEGYMGSLASFWLLNDLMIYPIAQPLLFRMLSLICSAIQHSAARILLGLLGAVVLYTYIFVCSALLLSLMIISLRTLRSEWLAALLLLISVLAGQMWVAFRVSPARAGSRKMVSEIS